MLHEAVVRKLLVYWWYEIPRLATPICISLGASWQPITHIHSFASLWALLRQL